MLKTFVGIFSLCGFILYFASSYAVENTQHDGSRGNELCGDVNKNEPIESFFDDYLVLNEYLANQYITLLKKRENGTSSECDLDGSEKTSLFVSNDSGEFCCNQNNTPSEIKVCKIIANYSNSHQITEAWSVLKKKVDSETRTEDKGDDGILSSQNNPDDTGDGESQNTTHQLNDVPVEQLQPETPPSPLNTYDSIVNCVENLANEKAQEFNDNLSKLEKELSSVVEYAKPISLSLMIVNRKVPKECISDKLSQ